VLAFGGTLNGVITATAMVYSASTNAWTSVGPMAQVRGGAMSGTLLTNGNVLIVGGTDTGTNELATAEIYHP
jgi:N-acetylneuraminic acid mutarotase